MKKKKGWYPPPKVKKRRSLKVTSFCPICKKLKLEITRTLCVRKDCPWKQPNTIMVGDVQVKVPENDTFVIARGKIKKGKNLRRFGRDKHEEGV